MGSILYSKNTLNVERTLKTPHHIYWVTTQSNRTEVFFGYAHLITSFD